MEISLAAHIQTEHYSAEEGSPQPKAKTADQIWLLVIPGITGIKKQGPIDRRNTYGRFSEIQSQAAGKGKT